MRIKRLAPAAMVFLVTERDSKALWHRPLALSPGWYALGLGVAFAAGLMYWSHRRQPRPGDPIRPFGTLHECAVIGKNYPNLLCIGLE